MAEQVRKQREHEDEAEGQEAPAKKTADEKKKADIDIDELLAEIDDVIEQNAEEFVKNYVQQGGE